MKYKILAIVIQIVCCCQTYSQIPLTTAPSGGNKKASVCERIGITDVCIHYDRPGVKGREGKIWGFLIHEGFIDQGFGSSKAAPWRAGANENTTFSFSTDVSIDNQTLPAGTYGFFIAYSPIESTVIFSKNSTSWGSYFYDPSEDALRIKVKNEILENSVEWLSFNFINQNENSATVALEWEKIRISFTLKVDYEKTQLESFRKELRTEKGFIWQSWEQAAQFCLQRNINLDQALQWIDTATGPSFGGEKVFQPWATKAQILRKLGKLDESNKIIQKALPIGGILELHQYARQLIMLKNPKEALEIFQYNYDKNPIVFTTIVGMARGLSSNGQYDKALKFANLALPLAPDPNNKASVETMIVKLKNNQDVN